MTQGGGGTATSVHMLFERARCMLDLCRVGPLLNPPLNTRGERERVSYIPAGILHDVSLDDGGSDAVVVTQSDV